MPEDARNRFAEDVFTHRVTKDGKVLISWQGRLVTTVTGNFKHGNEREGKHA